MCERPIRQQAPEDAVYTVVHEKVKSIFVHNFEKCLPILKILSLLDLAVNLQEDVMSYFPAHLKCVTTLSSEIQKIVNSNYTLDVFNTISLV